MWHVVSSWADTGAHLITAPDIRCTIDQFFRSWKLVPRSIMTGGAQKKIGGGLDPYIRRERVRPEKLHRVGSEAVWPDTSADHELKADLHVAITDERSR